MSSKAPVAWQLYCKYLLSESMRISKYIIFFKAAYVVAEVQVRNARNNVRPEPETLLQLWEPRL